MDKNMIEKYRREMLDTYRTRPSPTQISDTIHEPTQPMTPEEASTTANDSNSTLGGLIAIVTSIRSLYPVKGAKVTVFTGPTDNKTIIATDITDESGRTGVFLLPTPAKQLSLQSGSKILPYAQYNMLVEAEGYLDTIHLNIPVFSNVTSLQQSNLLLLETAGVDKSPQIFDEEQQFGL